jgi:hypothetical protein
MIINSFDQKMPHFYRTYPMGKRLSYFVDNFVIPSVDKRMNVDNITMGLLDTDRMVLRYQGSDIGFLFLVGSDFMFISK